MKQVAHNPSELTAVRQLLLFWMQTIKFTVEVAYLTNKDPY